MKSTDPARSGFLLYHLCILLTVPLLLGYLLLTEHTRIGSILGVCALHDVFHLYCPACGMTRALNALLHLQLGASLRANPLVLFYLLLFLYCEVRTVSVYRKEHLFRFHCTSRLAILFPVTFFGFAVLRNLLLVCFGFDPTGDLLAYWS